MSIEAKLRPAVEIVPSITSIIAGGVLIMSSKLFLIPENMAYSIGGILVIYPLMMNWSYINEH